jgi:hypothetical protein
MTADVLESLDPPVHARDASVRPVKNAPAHDTLILEVGRGGTNFLSRPRPRWRPLRGAIHPSWKRSQRPSDE